MENPAHPARQPDPEALRLPTVPLLFRSRALRFRHLAARHRSLAGYLGLMADLAEIQHCLAADFAVPPWVEPAPGRPPLDISAWPGDSAWRGLSREIARRLEPAGGALAETLRRILGAADAELETWARGLLAPDFDSVNPALAPFLAAALQVQWTAAAAGLKPTTAGRTEQGFLCPVCGSLPVASVLQANGEVRGLRYLCCSLCAAEWHRVRIHCVRCGSSKGVGYYAIEGAGEGCKAEACADCKCYIKVMDREKDPAADPAADDIATLGLDILMAEEGYERLGFNPLLIPGG